jgi:hypothetical protein
LFAAWSELHTRRYVDTLEFVERIMAGMRDAAERCEDFNRDE